MLCECIDFRATITKYKQKQNRKIGKFSCCTFLFHFFFTPKAAIVCVRKCMRMGVCVCARANGVRSILKYQWHVANNPSSSSYYFFFFIRSFFQYIFWSYFTHRQGIFFFLAWTSILNCTVSTFFVPFLVFCMKMNEHTHNSVTDRH